jgi:hypothetical protein
MAANLAPLRRDRVGGTRRVLSPALRHRLRPANSVAGDAARSARRTRQLAVALLMLLVLMAGTLVPSVALAQTTPGTLTVRPLRSLDFGRFAVGPAAGGAITVSPQGLRSSAGAVVLLASNGAGAAGFNVSRDGTTPGSGQAVSVSLPADRSVELSAGGGARMLLTGFQAAPGVFACLPDGGLQLTVGATLEVAPGQRAGSYSGSFSLTLNYE